MSIKAIQKLTKKYPNIYMLMLGSKNESEYLNIEKYIINNKLTNNIELAEKLPKKDWIKLSRSFGIMLSNPNIDNTPVSIIEGMALGMCIVTTKVGGIPYLLNDTLEALFVEPDDSIDLKNKIELLFNNSILSNTLSVNGRLKAEEFDWLQIKEKWGEILK